MDYLLNKVNKGVDSMKKQVMVLNLIINGLPSKPIFIFLSNHSTHFSFKPYYKWITF